LLYYWGYQQPGGIRPMNGSNYDWRDEPRRLSVYPLSLLVIFVGAVGLIVYVAMALKPWDDGITYTDVRTYADRDLEPQPPEQVQQPQ
jgi:hypothetical protein